MFSLPAARLSPGEAGGGISTQCLASYMGLPRSAWMAHILSSVVPLVLILSFAIANNVALACIVGSNCFLAHQAVFVVNRVWPLSVVSATLQE